MDDRPLCFVLMPFGTKKDPSGGPDIDFDAIYEQALCPAIEDAGMAPLRADEERTGGIIHKAMFERLLLCDFAVADLTTANANVFYELGVRHAVRPATTLAIFAARQPPPFDLNYLRSLPYALAEGNRLDAAAATRLRSMVAERLKELRPLNDSGVDSPLFQLLTDYPVPDLAHMKTDAFRDRQRYSSAIKQQLAEARRTKSADQVALVESQLPALDVVETGVIVDLFVSYRAVLAYDKMLALYKRMPVPLQRTVLVREQLAFAMNRLKQREEAVAVLQQVIDEGAGTSETFGLLGRVYKDRWSEAKDDVSTTRQARSHLDKAIAAYTRGFESDWRDAYPGINAVTLLDIKGDAPSLARKDELLPVVRFAVTQRLKSAKPDYWDYATLLELAVLASNDDAVEQVLGDALTAVREPWEPMTTANNLKLIRDARAARGAAAKWLDEVIAALESAGAAHA
ncbi:MAG TPA: TRAFs-binding domain-containing protein [Vicinamibacterales bacterium]|nr:TRAFs-binding domain-containing protein [Vicinamibacterales bacterium]